MNSNNNAIPMDHNIEIASNNNNRYPMEQCYDNNSEAKCDGNNNNNNAIAMDYKEEMDDISDDAMADIIETMDQMKSNADCYCDIDCDCDCDLLQ